MKEYIDVSEAAKRFPFSEAAIRSLIHKKSENGFDSVVIKVGRRVLINPTSFEAWIEGHSK